VAAAVGAAAAAASAAAARRVGGERALMNIKRLLRHFLMTRWYVHSVFPAHTLHAIEQAVRQAEFTHGGEIRFAVEGELSTAELFADLPPRERALQVFSELRVWDTANNNGVLIYVLLADHDVEIVADRGFTGRISNEEWVSICHRMESAFKQGDFERGALEGITAVSALVARHFPSIDRNELPDKPVLL
jgi:uncharacterized membrane protein